MDPDGVATVRMGDTATNSTSVHDWQPLKEIVDSQHPLLIFSNSQIITYFVTRTSIDGLPANDLKAINNSATQLALKHILIISLFVHVNVMRTHHVFSRVCEHASWKIESANKGGCCECL